MARRIFYAALAIAITTGAAYAYDELRFAERTLVFFRATLTDGRDGDGFRGRGEFERRRSFAADSIRGRRLPDDGATRWPRGLRDSLRQRLERERGEGVVRRDRPVRSTGAVGDSMAGRPPRSFDRRGGERGRRRDIALAEVGYYSLILAFAVMATFWVDVGVKRVRRH